MQNELSQSIKFQFTHPGGVRPYLQNQLISSQVVSIHAPGRGATLNTFLGAKQPYVSIHAPGRGATFLLSISVQKLIVSIHAPGRGATPRAHPC